MANLCEKKGSLLIILQGFTITYKYRKDAQCTIIHYMALKFPLGLGDTGFFNALKVNVHSIKGTINNPEFQKFSEPTDLVPTE